MRDRRASAAVWRFIKQTARWSVRADTVVGASKYFLLIWGAIVLVLAAVPRLLYVVLTSFYTTAGLLNAVIGGFALLLLVVGLGALAVGWQDRKAALATQSTGAEKTAPTPPAVASAEPTREAPTSRATSLA